jgi:hypothetical protein
MSRGRDEATIGTLDYAEERTTRRIFRKHANFHSRPDKMVHHSYTTGTSKRLSPEGSPIPYWAVTIRLP